MFLGTWRAAVDYEHPVRKPDHAHKSSCKIWSYVLRRRACVARKRILSRGKNGGWKHEESAHFGDADERQILGKIVGGTAGTTMLTSALSSRGMIDLALLGASQNDFLESALAHFGSHCSRDFPRGCSLQRLSSERLYATRFRSEFRTFNRPLHREIHQLILRDIRHTSTS